jgi:hypothetical protein
LTTLPAAMSVAETTNTMTNYSLQRQSDASTADRADLSFALSARYSRIPRNALELSGVSDTGRYLYAWLYQSPSRDVVPGLLRVGAGGLAEEIGWTARKVQKHLHELAGYVLVDDASRVLFILGAIKADPPRNPKQITAMARQFAQIPTSAVVDAAMRELEAVIKKSDKSLIDKWREFDCIRNSFGNSRPNSNRQTQTPTPTPHSDPPFPIPIQTQTPEEPALRAEQLGKGDYLKDVALSTGIYEARLQRRLARGR